MGKDHFGISADACLEIAKGLKNLTERGIEVGLVVGGGNIFRGLQGEKLGIERARADEMGMLATVMNGIALCDTLRHLQVEACVMSAIGCYPIVEPYDRQKACSLLEQKKLVIFVGGTGSPFFTTDTAAALRACEIKAEILLKATKVNGVYSKDPLKYSDAVRYEEISFQDALAQKLDVMDATSIALCMANRLPILVFNMQALGALAQVFSDKNLGTLVH